MIPTSKPENLLTVSDLINKLSKFDSNLPVIFDSYSDIEDPLYMISDAELEKDHAFLGCGRNRIDAVVIS